MNPTTKPTEPIVPTAVPVSPPVMDVTPPRPAELPVSPAILAQVTPVETTSDGLVTPKDQPENSVTSPEVIAELAKPITPIKPEQKPPKPQKAPSNGTGKVIATTLILMTALTILAVYAYSKSQ